jgi:hypothetical protein
LKKEKVKARNGEVKSNEFDDEAQGYKPMKIADSILDGKRYIAGSPSKNSLS